MKKNKIHQLLHLVAGIITLVYGFDTFEAGDFLSATYYLSLAIIFLIVAGSHTWISQKFLQADVAFYLVEGITIIYSGWLYKIKGHLFLFYIMSAAGGFYLIFSLIRFFFEEKPKHRLKRGKRRSYPASSLDTDERIATQR